MLRTAINTRALKASIKRAGIDCRMVRVGTGKHITLGLFGADASSVANVLISRGFFRTPMSGTGRNHLDMITLDR